MPETGIEVKIATLFDLKNVPPLHEAFGIEPALPALRIRSFDEAVRFIDSNPYCVIFFEIKKKQDLIFLTQLIGVSYKTNNQIKYFMLDSSKNVKFREKIYQIIPYPIYVINPKENFKNTRLYLDEILKTFRGITPINQPLINKREDLLEPLLEVDAKRKSIIREKSLNLSNDFWLIDCESDIKIFDDSYIVRLKVQEKNRGNFINANKTNLWEYRQHDTQDGADDKLGKWFFRGKRKPVYLSKEDKWFISGDSFELFYWIDSSVHVRLKADENSLRVKENSLDGIQEKKLLSESSDKRNPETSSIKENIHFLSNVKKRRPENTFRSEISDLGNEFNNLNQSIKEPDKIVQTELSLRSLNEEKEQIEQNNNELVPSRRLRPQLEIDLPIVEKELIRNFKSRLESTKKLALQDNNKTEASNIDEIFLGLQDNAKISVYITQKEQTYLGQFDDFYDDKMQVYIVEGKINKEEKLKLSMTIDYMEKRINFYSQSIPVEVIKIDDQLELITLQLAPKLVKSFQKFLKIIDSRQKSVNMFLNQVKGA
jgi:hypothetical protein